MTSRYTGLGLLSKLAGKGWRRRRSRRSRRKGRSTAMRRSVSRALSVRHFNFYKFTPHKCAKQHQPTTPLVRPPAQTQTASAHDTARPPACSNAGLSASSSLYRLPLLSLSAVSSLSCPSSSHPANTTSSAPPVLSPLSRSSSTLIFSTKVRGWLGRGGGRGDASGLGDFLNGTRHLFLLGGT